MSDYPDSLKDVEVSFDDLKDLLDEKYYLVFIDRDSNLNSNLKEVQKAIQNQDWCPIDESIDEWLTEAQWYGMDYALKELKEKIESEFEIDQEKAEELIDMHRVSLEDVIYDRDHSTPLSDLIRQTEDPVMFYETGEYVESGLMFDSEMYQENLEALKEVLNIQTDKYDKKLELMLLQASYGGRLVVYFREDIKEMMKLEGYNTITFKDPMIAVIDTFNGSGDHADLSGHSFSLPFDPQNIFLDRTIKYSYTYEVCGMYPDWCDSTSIEFSTSDNKKDISKSNLHAELEVEDLYKTAYENGSCTFGDMDIRRHRNTYYKNEFPCGTHCPHCGTFWID